ncbi:MAG: tyrosine--tRNA ligase [Fibromonadaceae bacterium]|jgi:tyrosyl-tRNA synthetase|nr:tyrosine--tRNA ligase [Fibromonadaceae bacterium]
MKFPPLNEQLAVLMRGVHEIVPENELAKKIQKSIDTGMPLRIKLGVDPTAPDVHLGHTVVMRKLRQFQELGHQAVLIVGDYTAMIGDPSGRNQTRPRLSHAQVMENAKEYQEQFFKVVKKEQTEIRYNGEWLSKMSFDKITELMSSITVAQMLEREDFQSRYANRQPISLHEFLYPLMQAYDSIIIKSDVELGGTDQKFNVLRGRELQLRDKMEPQIGLFMPILLGICGKFKMSKSLGNYVGINDSADEMFHKVYNLADNLAESWFELLTYRNKEEYTEWIKKDIQHAKRMLALDIVSQYYGETTAKETEAREHAVHSGTALPGDTPTVELPPSNYTALDLLIAIGAFASKGEARRMIQNQGVKISGQIVADGNSILNPFSELIIQIGKRKFYRVIIPPSL